ncbi:AmmeMemoRadiSam system radical SAM enzyme [Desulfovibrio sulfodismutans]|uniref:AmmeMemoRadiSam system radical SAM enzyme n=1 Tax=Desulfolutivibrio sulfodismutans TaxID=63561 RepID=A0A7K3NNI3_9BACT|nr:AmmeMemoRadiSam system radical SAM enzyme [Desulfolutivibrio sulfodismutans]NDY57677.1 AmmeMemoRadiSam system radical SAM enzyme [Desulfolutivibrio sulfodismutans]QLA12271.1 AmmeMemoRadiSam system radical SAM enzyme [Desulfolutivibrio sulfodismutans DSM 3696]
MHQAALWKPLDDGRVQCRLCAHFCRIDPGQRGTCGVRENRDGVLFTLVYDKVAAVNLDPVEKKPLYHFLPGSLTFSFGTMGCNLSCTFCQNASLSQPPRQGRPVTGHAATPEALVQAALDSGAASISYTYSEPTIFFELMRDTATLAKKAGLKNILVSNGFQSPQCLEELGPLIDAANIDLKAWNEEFYRDVCGARLGPVKKNLVHIRRLGWWLEVTTLLIPGLNDNPGELREMADFVFTELGADTPWHLSRFHPDHRMLDHGPTPPKTLEAARDIGRAAGLRFVYVGNLGPGERNDTLCPSCGAMVVRRTGFAAEPTRLRAGVCPDCGAVVAGVWGT